MWILYFDPDPEEEDYIIIDFTSGVSGECYGWSDIASIFNSPYDDVGANTMEDMHPRLVILHKTKTLAEMKLYILLES